MSATIVVAVHNRRQESIECLESVVASTRYPHDIVIIDNGSDMETAGALYDMAVRYGGGSERRIAYVRYPENEGTSRAWNRGWDYAVSYDAEYVCFLNNDTLVGRGWLQGLVEELEQNRRGGRQRVAILSPLLLMERDSGTYATCVLAGGDSMDVGAIRGLLDTDGEAEAFTLGTHVREMGPPEGINGPCMVMPCDIAKEITLPNSCLFDERFFCFWEEVDLARRALDAGYRLRILPLVKIFHHADSQTLRPGAQRKEYEKSRRAFAEIWGWDEDVLKTKRVICGILRD